MVSAAGKAFFITNLEPMKFLEFLSLLLEGLEYQRPFIKLPAKLLASYTRTFNCMAAQKDIGYSPIVSLEEGVTLTIESFSHLARDSSFPRCCSFTEQSKADKLLGGGKVADILLWRDEKKSFAYFLVLVLLFYWSFLSGRTFISSAARLLLLATLLLYGHGFLPSKLGSSLCEGMGEGYCTQPYPCICKEAVSGFEPMTNKSPRHNFTAAPGLAL
ncbi:3beta-hydroxysteroid-dehydrogenase/decarboxylase isoform 3 [Glycine soja]|nr:3beta-hydroxysteroid-dehydrogenase/decarboxylase isoform 3 [Glycine soja]